MYARTTKRSSTFPVSGQLERRHSLRLFSSSKRLSSSLTRCGSMRQISHKLVLGSDSSSSTEYPSTDYSSGSKLHGIFTYLSEVVANYVSMEFGLTQFLPLFSIFKSPTFCSIILQYGQYGQIYSITFQIHTFELY